MCICNHFIVDKLFNKLKASKMEKFHKKKKLANFSFGFGGLQLNFSQLPHFVANLKLLRKLKNLPPIRIFQTENNF